MTLKSKIGRLIIPLLPVNRRTFDILRFELSAFLQTVMNTCSPAYHLKVYKIRNSQRDLSVNVGSGGHGIKGWINIDLRNHHKDNYFAIDIRNKLPFKDSSVSRIYAEHVIEHLDFKGDIPKVLADFQRILRPDGILRIAVPDAGRFLSAYVYNQKGLWENLGWPCDQLPEDICTPMHIINHIFHQNGEHLFGYDFNTLKFALEKANFREIVIQSFRVSLDPLLRIDQEVHRRHSLYVDARK
jgi:predicted SAM-dependent methyltransferase